MLPRLPAYRISGPLSAKLRLVTLLAVTAVLWVHANNMSSRFVVGENAAEASGGRGGQNVRPSHGRRPARGSCGGG